MVTTEFRKKEDLDNLAQRLFKMLRLNKTDTKQDIERKLVNMLLKDSRGQTLLKDNIFDNVIKNKIIPRMFFKIKTGKKIEDYGGETDNKELKDFGF